MISLVAPDECLESDIRPRAGADGRAEKLNDPIRIGELFRYA